MTGAYRLEWERELRDRGPKGQGLPREADGATVARVAAAIAHLAHDGRVEAGPKLERGARLSRIRVRGALRRLVREEWLHLEYGGSYYASPVYGLRIPRDWKADFWADLPEWARP